MKYIKTLPPAAYQRLRIYLDTGTADTSELNEARQFHQILNRLKIPNEFNQFPGSHSWRYWRHHLADSLTYVGEQFRIANLAYSANNLGFDTSKSTQP